MRHRQHSEVHTSSLVAFFFNVQPIGRKNPGLVQDILDWIYVSVGLGVALVSLIKFCFKVCSPYYHPTWTEGEIKSAWIFSFLFLLGLHETVSVMHFYETAKIIEGLLQIWLTFSHWIYITQPANLSIYPKHDRHAPSDILILWNSPLRDK